MPQAAFLLLMNSIFLMLRIAPSDSFPRPLSKEEEEENLKKWLDGDIEARNTLIEHNLRLVSHIMKKYYTDPEDTDDLVSIGTIGLIKGINTYRPEKGVKLATYASRCIENELLMTFRSRKKNQTDVSLSDALDVDSEGGNLSVLDVVAAADNMEEKLEDSDLCRRLRSCIDEVLDAREKRIITQRYGLSGIKPLTQREIAESCKISRSYVSRLEKRALSKLRAALSGGDE